MLGYARRFNDGGFSYGMVGSIGANRSVKDVFSATIGSSKSRSRISVNDLVSPMQAFITGSSADHDDRNWDMMECDFFWRYFQSCRRSKLNHIEFLCMTDGQLDFCSRNIR